MKKRILFIIALLLISVFALLIKKFNILTIMIDIIISIFYYARTKDKKLFVNIFLIIYFISILYFMMLNNSFNRNIITGETYFRAFIDYIKTSINLVPFKTITNFIKHLYSFEEFPSVNDVYLNIIGNTICLIPVVFFYCYYNVSKKIKLPIILLLTSIIIELLQLATLSGSFDVDDLILNFLGSYFFYLAFKKSIQNFIQEDFRINCLIEKSLIKWLLLLILIILLIISYCIIKQREEKYWDNYYNFTITIEESQKCTSISDYQIYEDELFIYSLECEDYIKTIIKINNGKYSLYDYLKGYTMYPVSIPKLVDAGININTRDKWEKIPICPYSFNAITYYYEKDGIIQLVPSEDISIKNEKCRSFFAIPIAQGKTIVTFNGDFGEKKYEFIVKEKKEIEYKEK